MEQLYKAIFHYDNDVIKLIPFLKKAVEREYFALRHLAVRKLNGCYERWNNEYDGPDNVDESNELYDFGGTAYCDFIRKKQQPIIDDVNKSTDSKLVKLYSTEECDLGGVVTWKGNVITRFFVTFKEA